MQITNLRSIVTDVRRLTSQIINGRDARGRNVVRDGNKYPPLPLLRFTLRKLRNASATEYRTRIALSCRSLVYHFVRAIVMSCLAYGRIS